MSYFKTNMKKSMLLFGITNSQLHIILCIFPPEWEVPKNLYLLLNKYCMHKLDSGTVNIKDHNSKLKHQSNNLNTKKNYCMNKRFSKNTNVSYAWNSTEEIKKKKTNNLDPLTLFSKICVFSRMKYKTKLR